MATVPATIEQLAHDVVHIPDAETALRALSALRQELDQIEPELVARALQAGATWSDIARALGVSKQAAHRKHRELARTLQGAAAVLIAAAALAAAAVAPGAREHNGVWGSFTIGALVAACWVLGYALRTRRDYVATRRDYVAELRDRAARLEAEEGERAARAVMDERLRIARELHDVIGHSISLIAIQSEAAARSARSNPDAVPVFLSAISAASRQVLAEMRGVLAVLRPDAEAELSPQPGLEQVGELVASLRAGGLETRLEAEPMHLPPGMALAVYRIVQESLTNVLKHAGAGAKAADHCEGRKPAKPSSLSVGTSGHAGSRASAATASGRTLPALIMPTGLVTLNHETWVSPPAT